MKNIGIIANFKRPHASAVLKELAGKAAANGLSIFADPDTAKHLPQAECVPLNRLAEKIDVLFALGGDGTVLFAVNALAGADVPVFGINLGRLGFLTATSDENVSEALEEVLQGSCRISERTVLECRLFDKEQLISEQRALNDAVIGWGGSSHISSLALSINEEQSVEFMCDGIIIATPTGSTGHALSAGGPIIHPGSASLGISPICPHTLSNRPLVIPDTSRIAIEILKTRKKLVCSVDGQDIHNALEEGFRLEIRKSDQGVKLMRLQSDSYFNLLSRKLHWRGSNL